MGNLDSTSCNYYSAKLKIKQLVQDLKSLIRAITIVVPRRWRGLFPKNASLVVVPSGALDRLERP